MPRHEMHSIRAARFIIEYIHGVCTIVMDVVGKLAIVFRLIAFRADQRRWYWPLPMATRTACGCCWMRKLTCMRRTVYVVDFAFVLRV
jgi:hypothetical protein